MPKTEILDTDHIFPLLLKLSVPTMIGGFISALYNIVDSIFVGHFVGKEALAALAISNTIQLAFIAFAAWISVGTGTLISRSLGAKRYDRVNQILFTGTAIILICTFTLSLIMTNYLDSILLYMGATEKILDDTMAYSKIIILFGFLIPLNGVFQGVLRSKGLATAAMNLSLIGAIANIFLDALFIISFEWGVAGAAIATVISQFISLLVAIFYIIKEFKLLAHFRHMIVFDKAIISQIIGIGAPSGLRLGMIVIASLAANKALQPHGVVALASYGIVNRLVSLAFMPIQGCNFGAQPIISFNYGANRIDRVRKTLFTGSMIMLFIGVTGTLCFVFMPIEFFKLFTTELAIMNFSKEALAYTESFFFLFGIYMLLSGFIQSVGYMKEALFLALFRPLCNVFLYYILPLHFGLYGIFYAMPVTDIVNFFLAIIIAKNVYKKMLKKQEEQKLENIKIEGS